MTLPEWPDSEYETVVRYQTIAEDCIEWPDRKVIQLLEVRWVWFLDYNYPSHSISVPALLAVLVLLWELRLFLGILALTLALVQVGLTLILILFAMQFHYILRIADCWPFRWIRWLPWASQSSLWLTCDEWALFEFVDSSDFGHKFPQIDITGLRF